MFLRHPFSIMVLASRRFCSHMRKNLTPLACQPLLSPDGSIEGEVFSCANRISFPYPPRGAYTGGQITPVIPQVVSLASPANHYAARSLDPCREGYCEGPFIINPMPALKILSEVRTDYKGVCEGDAHRLGQKSICDHRPCRGNCSVQHSWGTKN